MTSIKISGGSIKEGAKVRLTGSAGFSHAGFSVDVTVIKIHPRRKYAPTLKQEVEVQLPDGGTVTVWAKDLWI